MVNGNILKITFLITLTQRQKKTKEINLISDSYPNVISNLKYLGHTIGKPGWSAWLATMTWFYVR